MSEVTFDERKNNIVKTLSTLFTFLGLSGEFAVEEHGEKRILVKITSTDVGRIIGRRGQTLESLQLILNRIIGRNDKDCPLILLNIDGDSESERPPRREDREPRYEDDGEEHHGRFRRREFRSDREDTPRLSSKEELERRALDAAKEVKRWGEPVKLPEMNAHDRRIIHLVLKDDPAVMTESEGEGLMRQVVIKPSDGTKETAPAPAPEEAAPVADEQ